MQREPIQFDAVSSSRAKRSAAGFASSHRMQKSPTQSVHRYRALTKRLPNIRASMREYRPTNRQPHQPQLIGEPQREN